MSKAKTYPYNVFYKDGSFMTVEITRRDYNKLAKALITQLTHVELSASVLELTDIRMVVEQKPQEPVGKERPILPALDVDSEKFLKQALGNVWGDEEGFN